MKRTNKISKKHIIFFTAAFLCIIMFAVYVYLILNPTAVQKVSDGGFDTSKDFIKFMDVGQGDSALIYSNGYCAVIDMGLPNTSPQIYKDLSQYNIKEIDAVVISHLHSDHIGALEKVASDYTVKNLIMPEILPSSIAAATNSKNLITGYGSSFYNAVQGMIFKIGEFDITILGFLNDKKNENNRSLIMMAEIDAIKFLFTGDAETVAEQYLLEEKLNLDCDVLKVSHHGSNTSSSKKFLNEVTPEYAVISVGQDNMYNHPHNVTLQALEKANAKIYRTDKQGDVIFNVENGKIKVETEK